MYTDSAIPHGLQLNFNSDSEDNVGQVSSLLHYIEPAFSYARCVDVLDRFVKDIKLQAVAIVDEHLKAVGIIDRGRISDIFLKPFSRDLLGKKSISEIMDVSPIIVDIHANIDDVAQIIIDSDMRHMVNGFIIQKHGIYAGMATGHSLLEEITRRKQRELFKLAHFDQLTGLPNRLLFKDRLYQACHNADRNNKMLALIFIDIDRFKFINDSLGHSAGDRLLQLVAERLAENVRQSDTVTRLGGDEFVIILQNVFNEEDVLNIVSNVVDQLRLPMTIFEQNINVTASIGIALYPLHDKAIDDLIRKADMAMYEVKQKGRNGYSMYTPGLAHRNSERLSLETELRKALDKGQLSLCYQPQINMIKGQIVGVEALLRWYHPELGNVSPATFIPIAEETGLIIPIGEWVLKESVQQHINWIEDGLPPLRIAVNISAVQFQHDDFLSNVKQIIKESKVDPGFLEFELTESVIMNRPEQTVKILVELRKLGLKLAIDDFGTGYSSLSYLRKFPIDRIKIDQSFVRDIINIPANDAIVRAIIALSESLGLETLAEGIENSEELGCIISHNCTEAQGYHFAKPLTAANLVSWYRDNRVKL